MDHNTFMLCFLGVALIFTGTAFGKETFESAIDANATTGISDSSEIQTTESILSATADETLSLSTILPSSELHRTIPFPSLELPFTQSLTPSSELLTITPISPSIEAPITQPLPPSDLLIIPPSPATSTLITETAVPDHTKLTGKFC